MSVIPDSKRLFDVFIGKLNDNTYGVNFDGNFIFRFWQQQLGVADFEIISQNPDTLNWEGTKVIPVVNTTFIEIPYVEKNKRSDYELEFYMAIEVPAVVNEVNQRVIEFDPATNEPYQALLEALEGIRNDSVETIEGHKYAFKTKEPSKVNIFKFNGTYYQVLALNVNVSAIVDGSFGNETELYFGLATDDLTDSNENLASYALDFVEMSVLVGKLTKTFTPLEANNKEQFVQANSRSWTAQITANFVSNDASDYLLGELHDFTNTSVDQPYSIRVKGPTYDYTHQVLVTNINTVLRLNGVVQITFTLERTL